ncbi:MAG: type III secretion system needle filament subunit SctF [Endozoicomonadaceae bacterium]|nr:type III secretion system needle filament subunit SctF [Endozoicomonadaceae bacterium]
MSSATSQTQSISFDTATERLSSKLDDLETKLQASMENVDPTNLAEMIKLQQEVNKLTMLYSLDSSVIKSVKDTAQGIIQKIS